MLKIIKTEKIIFSFVLCFGLFLWYLQEENEILNVELKEQNIKIEDKNKEIKQIAKIKKVLEQADKLHADLQYPMVVDTVTRVWDKINDAYTGLINYEEQVKKGKYDGTIDMDD